jgi:hypothetical protein
MKYTFAILVLLLTGCAASAQTPTGSAGVDVNALLRQHPLYGTLAQYDRQIAVLQSTLRTSFSNSGAQIDNATTAIRNDLDHASSAAQNYDQHIAVPHRVALNASPGAQAPGEGQIVNSIQQAYNQQHADLQSTAQRDMAQYRATLLAQQQAAYDTFVQSINGRTQRAYNARAQELRERESAMLLEFSRSHAHQRLMLRAKLQTLVLNNPRRRSLQAQLDALQNQEYAALDKMRAQDARTLNAYAEELRARGNSDISKMSADLRARTSANLAARERVLAAQTSTSGSLRLPSGKARSGSAADMQAQYNALANAPPLDTSAFSGARDDLTTRFHALHDADANDTASVRSQIDSLRHDREAVRKRMIAQIMAEAQTEAKARNLSLVYTSSVIPRTSVNLTSAVATDLRSLTP